MSILDGDRNCWKHEVLSLPDGSLKCDKHRATHRVIATDGRSGVVGHLISTCLQHAYEVQSQFCSSSVVPIKQMDLRQIKGICVFGGPYAGKSTLFKGLQKRKILCHEYDDERRKFESETISDIHTPALKEIRAGLMCNLARWANAGGIVIAQDPVVKFFPPRRPTLLLIELRIGAAELDRRIALAPNIVREKEARRYFEKSRPEAHFIFHSSEMVLDFITALIVDGFYIPELL